MPIKNYTTQIKADKTVMEIQEMLRKQRARTVLMEYSDQGILSSVSFTVDTPRGAIAFRLPANIRNTLMVLVCQNVPKWLQTNEQAARVAWRIIKDWVAAQLALVETEMVSLDQVFLPYALVNGQETVYDRIVEGGLKLLTEGE